MRSPRIITVAALAALACAIVPASPASAAAPTAPTGVAVSRLSTGGFKMSWHAVSGATSYKLYKEIYLGRYDPDTHGFLVDTTSYRLVATVTATTYTFADELNSGVQFELAKPRLWVVAHSAGGDSSRAMGAAPCATGYFIGIRGSGQNPDGSSGADADYAQGLGSSGKRVYEDLRSRLHMRYSTFQAIGLNYPAVDVFQAAAYGGTPYLRSKDAGVSRLVNTFAGVHGSCPDAHLYVFGFSQGGQVAGDGFTRASAAERARTDALVLFADAARNGADAGIEHLPTNPGGHGVAGTRPAVPRSHGHQISTWCYKKDFICRTDGSQFHGSQYDCYEKHVAARMALLARVQGYQPDASNASPTCTMAT